jgi:hypothetical protein
LSPFFWYPTVPDEAAANLKQSANQIKYFPFSKCKIYRQHGAASDASKESKSKKLGF